ncbi:Mce-associated membrane protein [Williamsia limnetica]|uniref:Mce-associated membrane protein n=1 Tax=Williamsia limnetica TaxID=882452 RepID=A0A318R9P9_WILLI|nr:hypothetical protein [Williamsia limnetica]PYE12358.1 Mce-associated membrane protein [Williamsia limnetica]
MKTALNTLLRLPNRGFTALADVFGRWTARRVKVVGTLMVVLTAAALGFCGYAVYEDHQDEDLQASGQEALTAARTMVPNLLTYKAESVDQDFAQKFTMLTGEFKSEFEDLSVKSIIPTAKERQIVTTAQVAESGLIDHGDKKATALLFINQTTTSTDEPDPKLDGSRVKVTVEKSGDSWKISALTPV